MHYVHYHEQDFTPKMDLQRLGIITKYLQARDPLIYQTPTTSKCPETRFESYNKNCCSYMHKEFFLQGPPYQFVLHRFTDMGWTSPRAEI